MHFNPRPREEGDVTTMFTSMEQDISIHALVKRATRHGDWHFKKSDISIHALVKRATTYIEHTTHEDGISIHALVKRATRQHFYKQGL